MFERYTEKARRVIFFARYEASQFGSEAIEPEHLLLGLVREDKGMLTQLFPRVISINEVRKDIEGRVLVREHASISVHLSLSETAKSVLELAAEESERLNHRYIGTEHLLVGLLREDRTIASEILYEFGVRLDAVRTALKDNAQPDNPTGGASSHGMSEGIFRLEQMGRLFGVLEGRCGVSMEEVGRETNRVRRTAAFQALLSVLARNGTITAEEFKNLSIESDNPESNAEDNS